MKLNASIVQFERSSLIFLAMLLAGDLVYIALHGLYLLAQSSPDALAFVAPIGRPDFFASRLFAIDQDLGYSETFQYQKYFWCTGMLIWLFAHKREKVFLGWALLSLYFLLDDSLSLHEKLGKWVSHRFDFPPVFGVDPQNLGELAVSLCAAIIVFPWIIAGHRKGTGTIRRISWTIGVFAASIVFFGVGLDMVEGAMEGATGQWANFHTAMVVVEDGGEMLAASFYCWYIFTVVQAEVGGGRWRAVER